MNLRLSTVLRAYAAALIFTVALSWGWVALAFEPPYMSALLLGWTLAVANASVGLALKWLGAKGDFSWFLFWAVAMSSVRLVILLLIVVAVHRWGVALFLPFSISLFTGFFAFMVCEIGVLHGSTARESDGA